MAKDDETYVIKNEQTGEVIFAKTKWTISRARDTYGYNICSLWVDGKKVASCDGGGYDMVGTVFGTYIAKRYAQELRDKITSDYYGLRFIDPTYDPGKAKVTHDGEEMTVDEAEQRGVSLGLDRYQAAYAATSNTPTERHTVPYIDGACGYDSVRRVAEAIGLRIMNERAYAASTRAEN